MYYLVLIALENHPLCDIESEFKKPHQAHPHMRNRRQDYGTKAQGGWTSSLRNPSRVLFHLVIIGSKVLHVPIIRIRILRRIVDFKYHHAVESFRCKHLVELDGGIVALIWL